MTTHSDRRRFSSRTQNDLEPASLLVADDDPHYAIYVVALARRLGFVADVAADGEEALEYLGSHAYDVAVIDQSMPRMTGMEVIARIRADESTRGLYALMLTAHEDIDTKLMALDLGFDDFVTKSSSEPELVAKLVAARRVAVRQRTLDTTVRELYGLATRDELTSVFNRRCFIAEGERMIAEGIGVSLVLFDLDDFKTINDRFGHLAGDTVLRDVGALFQRSTRTEDLVARYGGDEFVMLIVGSPPQDVERVALRLAEEVRAMQWSSGDDRFGIGVTTGIASSQFLDEPALDLLLDAADRDLYKNKWLRDHPEPRPPAHYVTLPPRRFDLVLPVIPAIDAPPSPVAEGRRAQPTAFSPREREEGAEGG